LPSIKNIEEQSQNSTVYISDLLIFLFQFIERIKAFDRQHFYFNNNNALWATNNNNNVIMSVNNNFPVHSPRFCRIGFVPREKKERDRL